MKLIDLPVGAKVREEKSGYVFLVGEHNHSGYAGTTLVADNVVRAACIDAKEPSNPNEEERDFGSSNYSASNIHRWLNSSEATWYAASHEFDAPPVPENVENGDTHYFDLPYYCKDAKYDNDYSYAGIPGFLSEFSAAFVDRLYESLIPSTLVTAPEKLENILVRGKMFLMSLAESGFNFDQFGDEGTKIELFNDPRMRYVSPVPAAIGKPSDHVYIDAAWWYWLRTPLPFHHAMSMRMTMGHRGGSENHCIYSHSNPCNAEGIRPACNIDSNIALHEIPDENGIYTLLPETRSKKNIYSKQPVYKRNTWVQEPNYDYPPIMKYNPKCPCHNDSCTRHGFCEACRATHKEMDHDCYCKHQETD